MMPRPLHSDWLCVTLLMATCDVTITLFIGKNIARAVILFNKNSTIILNKVDYEEIFAICYKTIVELLCTCISIDINIF